MSVIIESTTPAALRIGNVFYGSALLKCKNKTIKVNVSNHLEPGTKYEFRTAYKCKAGFIIMSDSIGVTTPENISNKIKNFSHQEYNTPEYTDISLIEKRITLPK